VLLGTDFAYRDLLPPGERVIQLDLRGAHIDRRTLVDVVFVGDARARLQALLPMVAKAETKHLEEARSTCQNWQRRPARAGRPAYESGRKGPLRRTVDNPEHKARPELVAATVDSWPTPTRSSPATRWRARLPHRSPLAHLSDVSITRTTVIVPDPARPPAAPGERRARH
jgi:hypothetical protein